jgi:hypothetical protein
MWDLFSCRRSKASKTKILDLYYVSSKRRGRRISHSGRLKDDRQQRFKYFRISISKFESLKQLLHTDIEKEFTQWGRSIT